VKESRVAGAGFILVFFEDVENLNDAFSTYVNTILELKKKYGLDKEDIDQIELSDEDRMALISIRQQLRNFIIRTYMKYLAVKQKVPDIDVDDKILSSVYDKITQDVVLSEKKVEKYIIEINKVFTSAILSDLLTEAKDIYHQFMG